MNDFRQALYEAALSAGLDVIPVDKCCRLMAWLYIYGGENEQVIEGRLKDTILYAQKRLNILGGEKPDDEVVKSIQGYVKSITGKDARSFFHDLKNHRYHNPPEWVAELEKEYGLKPRRARMFGEEK